MFTVVAHLTLLHIAPQRLILVLCAKLKLSEQVANLLYFLTPIIPATHLAIESVAECTAIGH